MPRIHDIIGYLQGTCISLENACANFGFNSEDLTIEELAELDNWLFYCDSCGWWYDVGERAYCDSHDFYIDNICMHCASDCEDD